MGDPLAALRPLHEPAPVPWWPPAPGWWLAVVLVLVAAAVLFAWRRHTAARRAALRELRGLERKNSGSVALAAAINRLLKRYALACYPRAQVADLTGRRWLDFLATHQGGRGFSEDAGQALLTLPYGGGGAEGTDAGPLLVLARRWIRANRPRGVHAVQRSKG